MQGPSAIRLHAEDGVAIACRALAPAEVIDVGGERVTIAETIAPGHKVAIRAIPAGAEVRKYGQIIGFASREISPGAAVHEHNCAAPPFARDHAISSEVPPAPPSAPPRTFRGYLRPDGRAGTRNYLAVLGTVNCSAAAARMIARRVEGRLADFPGVDGAFAITHKGGCGLAAGGEDHEQLSRTLRGLLRHPNVGGAIIVGLGCEVAQPSGIVGDAPRPPILRIQEEGGIAATVDAGVRAALEILPRIDAARRVELPAARLILGLQCGGSDAWSGITANPALGVASDLLVAQGGTAVLAETPEIWGAEHLLTRRAVSPAVAEALLERLRWWERYVGAFGVGFDANPSPGNKEGGISTIHEKSLGAVAKGGSTALTAVYRYAETVAAPGLVFMDTPGYDPVSMTGVMAGGATVCVFTTGRGSTYGSRPAPSIKVASTTGLWRRMEGDMDLDAGEVLAGVPLAEVGARIFERILAVAGGERTKGEAQGLGEDEIAPWSIGPTL